MKVLVSAYGCEPGRGSEPWLGWNWAKQIARFHEVWVLTRASNRKTIEGTTITEEYPNLHFLYFDLPSWMRFWKKGERGLHLYYYLWQIGAFFFVKKIYKQYNFHLVHHITFGGNWRPVFLSLLPIPFVWGPTGSEDMPAMFWPNLSLKEKIYEIVRFLIRYYGVKIDPFVRLTVKRSKVILDCNSRWVKLRFPIKYEYKIIKFFQNGITIKDYPPPSWEQKGKKELKVIMASKLIHWKGPHISARAFAEYARKDTRAILIVIGTGPYKKKMEDFFRKEGLSERVVFKGHLPWESFIKELQQGDIFLFTPFHQGQSTAVLQAMALGLPVIGLDCDAIGETVTADCGIMVCPQTVSQCVGDLSKAIGLLVTEDEKRLQMGKNGRKRVEDVFSWDKRGEELAVIYCEHILQARVE